DISIEILSGGNSANLKWAFSSEHAGRINNLRLGESILLGRETLHRNAIDGLHTDAITLVAEVIESKVKPTQPSGKLAQTAFGTRPAATVRGAMTQTILAIGIQDIDPCGLKPPEGTEIVGSSSDHLMTTSVVYSAPVGAEMIFQLDYSALVRAMTSPFVTKSFNSAFDVSSMRQIA
ncbi:MAG: alanine/ornithine racemase family PLP-dependent enzyme, partial [Woeseiaceae bacterium]